MKKFLLITAMIFFATVAESQVIISLLFGDKLNTEKLEFGLMVSPTYCNITNANADYRFGAGLGLYFNFKLNDRFYFHPEAIPKSSMGARHIAPYPTGNSSLDSLFSTGSIERKFKAISLPLLMRYNLSGRWFLETGPQIDWLRKPKDIYQAEIDGNDLHYEKKIDDDVTTLDIGWAGGLAYKFKKTISMSVSIRYFYGFTDVMKNTAGSQHNSTWLLNLYIPIGAAKAQAKREKKAAEQKIEP